MLALVVSLALGVVVGFAAHRASICTVRAVAEAMHARTGFMLFSLVKSMLWILLISLPVFLLIPSTTWYQGGWQLSAMALAGGLLFGLGAAINGACAYSIMARLVDGEVGMFIAILGFAVGIVAFTGLVSTHALSPPVRASTMIPAVLPFARILIAILVAFAVYEVVRLWRTRNRARGLFGHLLAHQYRLSAAAMLIGIAAAAIFFLFGSSGYSSTYQVIIEAVIGAKPPPSMGRWLLLVAVLFGMFLSTLQRRTFRLDWRPQRMWLRNASGGTLMGLGTALAPGGNDSLVLYGLPSLSPHAVPTYAALLAGSAIGLIGMRRLFGIEMRVACRQDRFVSDTWTPEGQAGESR